MSGWYLVLVALVGCERLAELIIAKRNMRWSVAQGGVVRGGGHYPVMVVLHTGLLAACVVEPLVAQRPFIPVLGWSMVAVVGAAQGLRWWCIATLGRQWNTQIVVVPGLDLVRRGPYRWHWLPHPNYVAVALEGAALPLVHSSWITAASFTGLNAILMLVRIRTENNALEILEHSIAHEVPRGPARARD